MIYVNCCALHSPVAHSLLKMHFWLKKSDRRDCAFVEEDSKVWKKSLYAYFMKKNFILIPIFTNEYPLSVSDFFFFFSFSTGVIQ